MKRRDFIVKTSKLLAALGALGATKNLWALAGKSYQEVFAAALTNNPVLLGWQGLASDIAPYHVNWQGRLPKALIGKSLYRNGPGKQQRGNERYQHWFDGDGFVNQFHFDEKGLTHQGKFVRTQKFTAEEKAGRFLYNGAGSVVQNPLPVRSNETINTANTALLAVSNEIWALWEAGAPYRLNQQLSTLGQAEFNSELAGVPFSAHPHQDKRGFIWNFGDLSFFGQDAMVIYQLDNTGRLVNYGVVSARASYVHDFAECDDYLIFYLPPIKRRHGDTFIEQLYWDERQGGELLIIAKHDLSVVKRIPFDPGFVFHFGQAVQTGNVIHLTACWYQDAAVMLGGMKEIAANLDKQQFHKSQLTSIHIDMKAGTAKRENGLTNMEFVQFSGHERGKMQVQYGIGTQHECDKEYTSVIGVDMLNERQSQFLAGKHILVEEPRVFYVNQQEQYLVNTQLDYGRGVSEVCVYNALNLADGPLCKATLLQQIPLGFHGVLV
jgi:all-trans-8'-apo-beta-carotenal 15,15'-oxygenase